MDDTQLLLNTLRRDGINSTLRKVDESPSGSNINMRQYLENHPDGGNGYFSVLTPLYLADAYYKGNLNAATHAFNSVLRARQEANEKGGIDIQPMPNTLSGSWTDKRNNDSTGAAYFSPGLDGTRYPTPNGSIHMFHNGESYPGRNVDVVSSSGIRANYGNVNSLIHEMMHPLQNVRVRTVPSIVSKLDSADVYQDLPKYDNKDTSLVKWKSQFSNENTKRFYQGYRDMFSPTLAPYYHSGRVGNTYSANKYTEAARAAGDLMWRARGLYFDQTGKHLDEKDPQLMQKAFELVKDYVDSDQGGLSYDAFKAMHGLSGEGALPWYLVPWDAKKQYLDKAKWNDVKARDRYEMDERTKGLINKFMEPIPGTGVNRASVTQNNSFNNMHIKSASMKDWLKTRMSK